MAEVGTVPHPLRQFPGSVHKYAEKGQYFINFKGKWTKGGAGRER